MPAGVVDTAGTFVVTVDLDAIVDSLVRVPTPVPVPGVATTVTTVVAATLEGSELDVTETAEELDAGEALSLDADAEELATAELVAESVLLGALLSLLLPALLDAAALLVAFPLSLEVTLALVLLAVTVLPDADALVDADEDAAELEAEVLELSNTVLEAVVVADADVDVVVAGLAAHALLRSCMPALVSAAVQFAVMHACASERNDEDAQAHVTSRTVQST